MPDSPTKKKKREPEDETPEDQQAPATAFSVTKILKPQRNPPIVALTPGFSLPDSFPFNVYEKDEQPTAKRRKSGGDSPPTELILHSSAHRSIDYTAREEYRNSSDKALNHWLATIDTQSGEVEVMQARKMVVRATVRDKQAPPEAMEVGAGQPSYAAKKMELGETFGTRKAKASLRAVAENAELVDRSRGKLSSSDRALVKAIAESSQHMATQEELQAAANLARLVPQGNFDAVEIQDVYVPSQIIGAEVLNAIPITDWKEKAKKMEEVQVPSRFVANRINRVAGSEDVQRLKLLRYLLWVLVFYTTTRPGRERGTKSISRRDKLREDLAPAPDVVIENIRRKFSDNGVMRKAHVDLLRAHCCVFASIIDSFEVNTLDLKEDLGLQQAQINLYFAEIGARTRQVKAGNKVNNLAKLALPLQFPKMKQMAKRR